MAGMAGFEPTNARVKVWCLTAWRHPNLCPGFGHTGYYSTSLSKMQEENYEFPEEVAGQLWELRIDN